MAKRAPLDPLSERCLEELVRQILASGLPLVLGVRELATVFNTSPQTIYQALQHDAYCLPPQIRAIDGKHRWALPQVVLWLVTESQVREASKRPRRRRAQGPTLAVAG